MKEITREWVRSLLPIRRPEAHKGSFGRVLVVAGSREMCGAGLLCAKSALLAGAGLVFWALPESMQPSFAASLPEAITLPLPETESGKISAEGWPVLKNFCSKHGPSLLVVGPGMGESPLLPILFRENALPTVIDADALNYLAGVQEFPRVPAIFTPHPGEAARLLGQDFTPAKEEERLSALQGLVALTKAVCVLKGRQTLVGAPHQTEVYRNTTGGVALAKGGSGDVLAGMIASFAAQGYCVSDAAAMGVYLHGLAGDITAEKYGYEAMLPTDMINELSSSFRCLNEA
jgi:NAD(P)H-hydrate epimerase